jgi:hypothetical protein
MGNDSTIPSIFQRAKAHTEQIIRECGVPVYYEVVVDDAIWRRVVDGVRKPREARNSRRREIYRLKKQGLWSVRKSQT